jgi:ABC-type transport system involved in multi-copper enzyme maturation permease subunit
MLTQPISRKKVLLSEYTGIASSLVAAFLVGVGVPVLLYHFDGTGMALLLIGALLTLVFTSIAFLGSVLSKDKARGIGVALMLWFYFALIYDGLVLLVLFSFSDYPLEKLTADGVYRCYLQRLLWLKFRPALHHWHYAGMDRSSSVAGGPLLYQERPLSNLKNTPS